MIYAIASILTILGSLAAWVYSLLQHNNSLKYQLAQKDAANEIREWQDRIDKTEGRIKEDVKDYENTKKNFGSNNSSGAV